MLNRTHVVTVLTASSRANEVELIRAATQDGEKSSVEDGVRDWTTSLRDRIGS